MIWKQKEKKKQRDSSEGYIKDTEAEAEREAER